MSPLWPLPLNAAVSVVAGLWIGFAGNGGVNETGDWRVFSSPSNAVNSIGGVACEGGDGGVADARGDACGSDPIEAFGVGVLGGGGDGIAGGDCESGISKLRLSTWFVFIFSILRPEIKFKLILFNLTAVHSLTHTPCICIRGTHSHTLTMSSHNFFLFFVTIKLFSFGSTLSLQPNQRRWRLKLFFFSSNLSRAFENFSAFPAKRFSNIFLSFLVSLASSFSVYQFSVASIVFSIFSTTFERFIFCSTQINCFVFVFFDELE